MSHQYTYEFQDLPLTINGKHHTWVNGFATFEDDPGYEPLLVEIEIENTSGNKPNMRLLWATTDALERELFSALSIQIFQETKAEEYAAAEFAQLASEEKHYGY